MRKHKKEMIRFIESEYGTEVWYKNNNSTKWRKSQVPRWDKDTTYIVDDEYATLRKESIDTKMPIQVYNKELSEWQTPNFDLEFDGNIKNYRLKPDDHSYPIYKKAKNDGSIVKFTALEDGVVVVDTEISRSFNHFVGTESKGWVRHTNTDVWENYNYKEPVYYYKWEKVYDYGVIEETRWMTDEYAEKNKYYIHEWRKIKGLKRVWEDKNEKT